MQPPADLHAHQEPAHGCAGHAGSRLRWWLLSCAALSVVFVLVYPFPVGGRAWSAIFNFAHAPTFFVTFLFIATLLDPTSVGLRIGVPPVVSLSIRHILSLSAMLFVAGFACEIAQSFVDRQSSLMDVAANSCGIVAAALYCSLFRIAKAWKWFVLPPLIGIFLFLPGLQPFSEMVECLRQSKEFPLLASFERREELRAWKVRGGTRMRDTSWATHGKYSVKLQGAVDKDLSFTMNWPIRNWTGYSSLQLDIFNPTDSVLNLGISIGDEFHQKSKSDPNERFSTSVKIDAHQSQMITLTLQDIQEGPVSRELLMSEICMINFFPQNSIEPIIFYLDNLRLIP